MTKAVNLQRDCIGIVIIVALAEHHEDLFQMSSALVTQTGGAGFLKDIFNYF